MIYRWLKSGSVVKLKRTVLTTRRNWDMLCRNLCLQLIPYSNSWRFATITDDFRHNTIVLQSYIIGSSRNCSATVRGSAWLGSYEAIVLGDTFSDWPKAKSCCDSYGRWFRFCMGEAFLLFKVSFDSSSEFRDDRWRAWSLKSFGRSRNIILQTWEGLMSLISS